MPVVDNELLERPIAATLYPLTSTAPPLTTKTLVLEKALAEPALSVPAVTKTLPLYLFSRLLLSPLRVNVPSPFLVNAVLHGVTLRIGLTIFNVVPLAMLKTELLANTFAALIVDVGAPAWVETGPLNAQVPQPLTLPVPLKMPPSKVRAFR